MIWRGRPISKADQTRADGKREGCTMMAVLIMRDLDDLPIKHLMFRYGLLTWERRQRPEVSRTQVCVISDV